jgi:hypothetical protein
VVVAAIGSAQGSRAAAAALACAGADQDRAALFIDLGARVPKPTLVASSAARNLEQRIARRLPGLPVAARGQTCHVAAAPDAQGFSLARLAAAEAGDALVVVHVAPNALSRLLSSPDAPRFTTALLRVDRDQSQADLDDVVARDLLGRGVMVSALHHRLSWVEERRALFGAAGDAILQLILTPGVAASPVPAPEDRGNHLRTEPGYTVVGHAEGTPFVVSVYTFNGAAAALDLAHQSYEERQGEAAPELEIVAVFEGDDLKLADMDGGEGWLPRGDGSTEPPRR